MKEFLQNAGDVAMSVGYAGGRVLVHVRGRQAEVDDVEGGWAHQLEQS